MIKSLSDNPQAQPRDKFEIVDDDSERADLARRKEIKFQVVGADIGKIRTVLEGGCQAISHQGPVSHVRSVYFDDLQLSACRANLDGLGRRKKLRVRWYDSLTPGEEFFVEIKWRDNRVTGKHRLQLRSARPLADLSYCEWRTQLIDVLPDRFQPQLEAYREPIVLVEYKRQHFQAPDSRLRLTIDYDVKFYDQTSKQRISTSFGQPLPNLVVVEGKAPVGRERELRGLLYPMKVRATRCSKYVYGCRSIGLLAAGTIV